jgi:ankyrin repeat protein
VKVLKIAIIAALFVLSQFCSQRTGYKVYSDVKLHPTSRKGSFASRQTIEGLLYEIWTSGFIRKNDLTKQEILNNAYGVFRKAPKTLSEPDGRAYYQKRKAKKDLLMLNASLFGHLEPVPKQPHMDKVRVKKLDEGIRATLVHELFHDFWHNILDERKRFLFTDAAEIFFIELMLAKTESQKQQVLDNIGTGHLAASDFESFEVLLEIQDIYSPEKVGTELFSILAGRAYSGESMIPKQFRKYYAALVSDEGLNQCRHLISPDSNRNEKSHRTKNFKDPDAIKKSFGVHPELITTRDKNGFSPLHYAAYAGNKDLVRFLMAKGADIESTATSCAWTPFFLAVFQGRLEIAQTLIDSGVPVDTKDRRGRSALHIAAHCGHLELIRYLLEHGAGIHAKDAAGMIPLHMAALCGRQDTASFLIAMGASAKSKDYSGQTPLHLASFCGNKKLVELLIAKGAAIDERDHMGETALHIAAFCGHQEVVELLMERRAELDIKNFRGKIPLEIASRAGHEKIASILRRAVY